MANFSISAGYQNYYGKNSIINFKYRIYEYPEILEPGGYSVPFTLKLPRKLPGSFCYPFRNTEKKSAFIAYKFHAKLLNAVPKQELKGKVEFTIKSNPNHYKTDLEGKIATRLCRCCLNNGDCELSFIQKQNFYSPFEVASILVNIDNSHSNIGVKAIRYKFYNSLRLRLHNKSETKFKQRKLIQSVISTRILPRSLSENQVEILIDLASIQNRIKNTYSTKGKLIACAFMVDVQAVMDSHCSCSVRTPTLTMALNIVSFNIEPARSIEAPADWKPLVTKRVIVEEYFP